MVACTASFRFALQVDCVCNKCSAKSEVVDLQVAWLASSYLLSDQARQVLSRMPIPVYKSLLVELKVPASPCGPCCDMVLQLCACCAVCSGLLINLVAVGDWWGFSTHDCPEAESGDCRLGRCAGFCSCLEHTLHRRQPVFSRHGTEHHLCCHVHGGAARCSCLVCRTGSLVSFKAAPVIAMLLIAVAIAIYIYALVYATSML